MRVCFFLTYASPYSRHQGIMKNLQTNVSAKLVPQTTTNANGTSALTIPGPVTTEEKAQKKNDVIAISMLLMAHPNEHLLTFSQYKDAKTLFEAIQARFSGNDATKKTQRTLLKQMYENFNASSTESLDSIFNRLQKIVSHTNEVDTASIQVSAVSTPVSTISSLDNTANLRDATVCFSGLLAVIDSDFELCAWSCELTSFWPAAATVGIPASLSVLAVLKPKRLKADKARNE
nr:ribonuclease H-like domain-containing protein [Tanacetum cinerariifolium]